MFKTDKVSINFVAFIWFNVVRHNTKSIGSAFLGFLGRLGELWLRQADDVDDDDKKSVVHILSTQN